MPTWYSFLEVRYGFLGARARRPRSQILYLKVYGLTRPSFYKTIRNSILAESVVRYVWDTQ